MRLVFLRTAQTIVLAVGAYAAKDSCFECHTADTYVPVQLEMEKAFSR